MLSIMLGLLRSRTQHAMCLQGKPPNADVRETSYLLSMYPVVRQHMTPGSHTASILRNNSDDRVQTDMR